MPGPRHTGPGLQTVLGQAGAVSVSEWRGLYAALDRNAWLDDQRFNAPSVRAANGDVQRDLMGDAIKHFNSADILARLDANDVTCAPVLGRDGLLGNEQLRASGTIERRVYEGFGEVRQARSPAQFEKTPSAYKDPERGSVNTPIRSSVISAMTPISFGLIGEGATVSAD